MKENFDYIGPENELTAEQKLGIAINLSCSFFQEKIDYFKNKLDSNKASVIKDLSSPEALFIDSGEGNLQLERQYLSMAKKGNFFDQVESDDPDSIYSRLRRELNVIPNDIEDLIKEKGNSDDPEIKELQDDEARIKLIVEAMEATRV